MDWKIGSNIIVRMTWQDGTFQRERQALLAALPRGLLSGRRHGLCGACMGIGKRRHRSHAKNDAHCKREGGSGNDPVRRDKKAVKQITSHCDDNAVAAQRRANDRSC